MGTLFLVATPIGNLEDISFRAVRILREVSLIAAEDTRRTGKLLSHYDIEGKLISYYEHNKLDRLNEILSALSEGDVALVSDAGTPLINDPGYELVLAVLEAGYEVSPIPGPSAPIAALIASGLPSDAFLYLGYLPRKEMKRREMLREITNLPYTLIFLETPQRLLNSLNDLVSILGDRKVAVARELTKLYEEVFRGNLNQALEYFNSHSPRGEFTLVVAGYKVNHQRWTEEHLKRELGNSDYMNEAPSVIAGRLAKQSGWRRRDIYQMILDIKEVKD